ncbi:hypothetical protein D3C85_1621600 [compost metagenome]
MLSLVSVPLLETEAALTEDAASAEAALIADASKIFRRLTSISEPLSKAPIKESSLTIVKASV